MIKNVISLSSKQPNSVSGNPKLPKSITTFSTPTSTLINQNPILHHSNRIVTVGLISSYGKEGVKTFATTASKPLMAREPSSSVEGSYMFEGMDLSAINESSTKTPTLSLFKGNANPEKGAAFHFRYSYPLKSVFVEAAPQKFDSSTKNGLARFDWDSKIVIKVNVNELGKLLTVFAGSEKGVELKHSTEKDGKKITSSLAVAKDADLHYLKLTRSIGGELKNSLTVVIDQSDTVLVTEFFRCAIRSGLGFF